MFFRKRYLNHPRRAKLRAYLAAFHGVSEKHLLETIRKRKAFIRARMYRRRSRKRTMEKNPKAGRRTFMAHKAIYSGQGELHGLLAALQMTPAEFCRTFDVPARTFHGWRGFPLRNWPLHLLHLHGRAQAMDRYLEARGVDPRQFELRPITEYMTTGRYPRTREQFPRIDLECSSKVMLVWCEVCRRNTQWLNERCSACKSR